MDKVIKVDLTLPFTTTLSLHDDLGTRVGLETPLGGGAPGKLKESETREVSGREGRDRGRTVCKRDGTS